MFIIILSSVSGSVTAFENRPHFTVSTEADDIITRVLFDAIGENFGLKFDYVQQPNFEAILNSIENGNSDFAANITYTEERSRRFDFSQPTNIEYTYLYSYQNLDLAKVKRLGVPEGTVYSDLISINYPEIEIILYNGHDHAVQLLESRQVEGVIDAINQLKPLLLKGFGAQLLNDYLSIQPVSIITPTGKNSVLLARFVSFIHSAEFQKQLRESIEKYQLEIRTQALRQSIIESDLNLTRTLKIKLQNVSPYAFYTTQNHVHGIGVELVKRSCEILMFNCEIVSTQEESWESMYDDLLNKKIDILAPLAISERRKALMNFSDVHYQSDAILLKREGYKENVYRNVSELVVERIGVIKKGFIHELFSQLLPNKEFTFYNSREEKLNGLLKGEVDYIVMNETNFNRELRKSKHLLPIEKDALIGDFYTANIAFAFPKNELGEKLVPFFNQAIQMIDIKKIQAKYDLQPDWRSILLAEKRFAQRAQWLFTLVIAFMVIVSMYLHVQSTTDNLTRLKNRRALHRRYRAGVGANLTLIYLDINDFKIINDTYGHEVGDDVLRQVSHQIRKVWRGSCYRIGGDEFILVGVIQEKHLTATINQLTKVNYHNLQQSLNLDVYLAIGVSSPRKRFMSLESAMDDADKKMYRNKHSNVCQGEFMFGHQ
ncbi:transporter substrate-binding domain-containing protein [Vibrio sp. ZSDE26]|uniref:Transporter substrate-binding domain-containing protein n=1 Tax=Vibrio amylolyticus TaxID=2847292 RepID=A0A9X2BH93_9VIBR|nr:GGDEF domain-containing protein [Vibrio amylolyticus]MCK6262715.1 transporter substrate-binding domain-containing protein [Vibrio amylolyticus]